VSVSITIGFLAHSESHILKQSLKAVAIKHHLLLDNVENGAYHRYFSESVKRRLELERLMSLHC
jgi:hypothetical protein